MRDTPPRRPGEGPYRAAGRREAPEVVDELRPRDVLLLALLLACVASVGHWQQAVEVVATRVLGFPSIHP